MLIVFHGWSAITNVVFSHPPFPVWRTSYNFVYSCIAFYFFDKQTGVDSVKFFVFVHCLTNICCLLTAGLRLLETNVKFLAWWFLPCSNVIITCLNWFSLLRKFL